MPIFMAVTDEGILLSVHMRCHRDYPETAARCPLHHPENFRIVERYIVPEPGDPAVRRWGDLPEHETDTGYTPEFRSCW